MNFIKQNEMKKLLILLMLIGTIPILGQQKTIIDYPEKICILDSSKIDTSYAPIYITKSEISTISKNPSDSDGIVNIYLRNSNTIGFRDQATNGDFILNASDFNDFSSNEDLCIYLNNISPINYSGYILKHSIDANSNIDTTWFVEKSTNDTSFYWWGVFGSSTVATDSSGWSKY